MTLQTLLRLARAWLGLTPERTPTPAPEHVFPSNIAFPPKPVYEAFTRTYNFLGALVGILLLSPLLITIAIAVKVTSPGPALYRGGRVGRNEKVFDIFKFRTMKTGSEQAIGKRLVRQDEDHYTRIGKFLRKYRLDELAQLINVLRGDMNLVGPRPVRPIFLEDHKLKIPGYARRFHVRPGITGQAQVRGGYYTHPRHKLFYEALYIANRGVVLDLQLIALTFLRVMTRIFTTGMLLAWLVAMALVLPEAVRENFYINLRGFHLNLLYLVPPLIAVGHVLRREVTSGRIYALRTPVDLPLLGFLLVSAAIIPFSRTPLAATRGVLWYTCNGAVVFYIVLNSRMVTEQRSRLIGSLVGIVTVVGLLAVAEMLITAAHTGEFTRLAGTVGNPLVLAAIVVLTLPLAVVRFRNARRTWRRRLYLAAAVLLMITALLTLSRSGMAAVALALGLVAWRLGRRYMITVAAIIGVLAGAAALSGDARMRPQNALAELSTAYDRQMDVLGNVTPRRLAIGVGARSLPSHISTVQKHGSSRWESARHRTPALESTYLTLLVDHGPIGLAFFLAFVLGGIAFMFRTARHVTDSIARDDLWATAAGLVGCCLLMAFADALYRFPMMIMFWSAMGLGVGLALHFRPGPKTYYRLVHYRHQL